MGLVYRETKMVVNFTINSLTEGVGIKGVQYRLRVLLFFHPSVVNSDILILKDFL